MATSQKPVSSRSIAAGKKPVVKVWTTARKTRFLDELALTCNVAKSARAAKVTDSSAYRLRERSEAFREAWAVALRIGYERLELSLLEQALNDAGAPPLPPADAKAREAANRLALNLLQAHRDAVVATAGRKPASARSGSAREWFEAKLAEMNKRMGGDG